MCATGNDLSYALYYNILAAQNASSLRYLIDDDEFSFRVYIWTTSKQRVVIIHTARTQTTLTLVD